MSRFLDSLLRSEYFKTALNTSVGNNNKVLNVEECSPYVLAAVVDFMYGIGIPEVFTYEDAKTLLAMADLYLMEDLKDAVASLIANKQTNKDNIMEISKMAEKYCAQKLKEMCCEFIFKNLNTLDKKMLVELNEVMPLLGEKAWLKLINKEWSENSTVLANTVLGILTKSWNHLTDPFKRREDFGSDLDYKGYVMTHIKPNMLVACNKSSYWGSGILGPCPGYDVPKGTAGRVISCDMEKGPRVKWFNICLHSGVHDGRDVTSSSEHFLFLDLLTPPIAL